MFNRLRNKLILMNLAVTTVVLLIAFSAIYAVAQNAANQRKEVTANVSLPRDVATNLGVSGYIQVVVQTVRDQVEAERKESLQTLLRSLFSVGFLVELAVAVLSYALAEASIRPVQEAYESQKIFIANASHEMKTPIASIMANLEVAEIKDNPWIDNVSHEVKALATLNQQLLALARVENAMNITQPPETVVLKDFTMEVLEQFKSRIKQKKINYTFKTKLQKHKTKLVKTDYEQIVKILMDNALKYCDKKITVNLSAKKIIISNDGAKISTDDLTHIFDRFYQTNKSSEGVGLGLAIAKSLAERNDWRLIANSNQESTWFTLEF